MSEQMTREQILAMEPGEELDVLIAEKVMGWKECGIEGLRTKTAWGKPSYFDCNDPRVRIHDYSTDISAAWEVVEKMRDNKVYLDVRVWPGDYQVLPHKDENNKLVHEWIVRKHSMAEAICKAALLAAMVL